jgi:hypothetical protein
MSGNAGTWFYAEPEARPYYVTERLNSTFWQARVVGVYWRCDRAEAPFHAQGLTDGYTLDMEWQPGQWLRLIAPAGLDVSGMVKSISGRILAMKACIAYHDKDGRQFFEWHTDGGKHRWTEIQGKAGYVKPRKLA